MEHLDLRFRRRLCRGVGAPTKSGRLLNRIHRLHLPASSEPAVLGLRVSTLRRPIVAPPRVVFARRVRQWHANQLLDVSEAHRVCRSTLPEEIGSEGVVLTCHVPQTSKSNPPQLRIHTNAADIILHPSPALQIFPGPSEVDSTGVPHASGSSAAMPSFEPTCPLPVEAVQGGPQPARSWSHCASLPR
jgi:hypothetical protein